MLIVFFAGLIIMASGSTLGNLCNIEYLSIVCNIIGGIMMGCGACYAVKYVENKRKELELRLEKMPGKEEHENNIRILSSIESLLKGHGEILAIIEQDQKKIISIVEDSSEIKNIKKIIEDENTIINDALEGLKKANVDSLTKIGDSLSDLVNKSVGFSDKLTQLSELIQKENTDIVESLQSIDQRAVGISVLPQEISESIDTLIVKFENAVNNIQTQYKYLSEDIEEQETKRTEKYKSIMDDIMDTTETSNEEMIEEIKKLADQYASFEKMINAIVENISHMAEEDIKVMKGFLNG